MAQRVGAIAGVLAMETGRISAAVNAAVVSPDFRP